MTHKLPETSIRPRKASIRPIPSLAASPLDVYSLGILEEYEDIGLNAFDAGILYGYSYT